MFVTIGDEKINECQYNDADVLEELIHKYYDYELSEMLEKFINKYKLYNRKLNIRFHVNSKDNSIVESEPLKFPNLGIKYTFRIVVADKHKNYIRKTFTFGYKYD